MFEWVENYFCVSSIELGVGLGSPFYGLPNEHHNALDVFRGTHVAHGHIGGDPCGGGGTLCGSRGVLHGSRKVLVAGVALDHGVP